MSLIDASLEEGSEELDDETDLDQDEAPEVDEERQKIEAQARAMGWHPLSEFRGDPSRWTDAPAFVRRAEDNVPVLRENLRRMTDTITKNDREITELRRTSEEQTLAIRDLTNLARRASEQGYNQALKDLEAQRRDAIRAGDEETVEQLEDQIGTLKDERAKVSPEAEAPRVPAPPPMPSEIADFAAANPWWNKDRELSEAMIAHHTAVMKGAGRTKSLADQLAIARARVVADFPDAFPDESGEAPAPPAPRRVAPRAAAVATPRSGVAPVPESRRDPFMGIADERERAEARNAFRRIQNQGSDMSAGDYVSLFLNPDEDVLALQRRAKKRN